MEQDEYITTEGKEAAEAPAKSPKDDDSASDATDDEPIGLGNRAELTRLASMIRSRSSHSIARTTSGKTSQDGEALQRRGTLEGLEWGDDVLDPQHANFDLYKWVRKTLNSADEVGMTLQRAGLVFKNVNVSGSGSALNIQPTVGRIFTAPLRLGSMFGGKKQPRHILHDFNGLLKSGELLIVLGRPGSGCSTLLKTLTGQMHGLNLDEGSTIHYDGIPQHQMMKEFKGEVIYNQEVDKHFPHLTVGETLEHAAALRTPQKRPFDMARGEFAKHVTQVVMAVFGLSHTYNTKVGDDFVRGVSGGERKRVSIAEMTLAQSLLAAWDNSTRGLDSATALKFVESLRLVANLAGSTHAVAVYQASQGIYDLFDKAVVLYEGREIFYGPAHRAQAYFEEMGWYCPPRQTTGDFLTSVTNPDERQPKEGSSKESLPRTPVEFEAYWKKSEDYSILQREITAYEEKFPVGDAGELEAIRAYRRQQQAKHTRPKSSYTVSLPMQVRLNMKRAFHRIINDKPSTFVPIAVNIIMALIIGSVFFDTPDDTGGFRAKGAVLFFAILLSALSAINEINSLYQQRPIVEKHKSYAFYHPATEAIAGIVLDLPLKFAQATAFNIILYFMAGLRREPSQFFIFFLINYTAMFVMAAIFRTLAAVTKSVAQAMALSGVMILAIVVYTGFVIPVKYMHPWFSWIRYINPIFYAFEILVANEFHGRNFACSQFVPAYNRFVGDQFVCAETGAVAGDLTVNGDAFILASYGYKYSIVWRNFGILIAFLIAFMAVYFLAVELNSETTSTAEVLVFREGHVPEYMQDLAGGKSRDEESGESEKTDKVEKKEDEGADVNAIPPQTDVFTWRDVTYDIEIKGEPRRLLDNISGYVKPGTLTALMGTSGAGKTTLLDVLAQRTTMGVVTGSMFVNGAPLDASFQRKTGYCQQQDLHLETATVRESLRFSAMLRQPKSVSRKDKYEYVEEVIKLLNMEDFAEAVVGVPGQGLNVEQRKLLTIGVELAAKPKLLLFLDEPTSGLDSQSSWAICAFLRKLADAGQAVLCTIHQPSAILFQEFDRLLFLRKGGKTVYFGKIGDQSRTLLDYFEKNGARHCDSKENPAEYMLEVVADENHDWVQTWRESPQAKEVQQEIDEIHASKDKQGMTDDDPSAHSEFAVPLSLQFREVIFRIFQQYWRMPAYIIAKVALSILSGLFIGFSFYNANSSLQGLQNVLYSLFLVNTIFNSLVQQIMPLFVVQRSLYEVRERPSKAYSWKAFIVANIVVEIPYQIVAGLLVYCTFYYPVVGIQSSQRQGLVLLFAVQLLVFASTFAQMVIAALPDAQTAGAITTLLFAMMLIFNGVMQPPDALPGFWIFMYRVSPLTYWVSGVAATMLHGRPVICSDDETSIFNPPSGQTCGAYLSAYLKQAPGYLLNPQATTQCKYCQVSVADQFLATSKIYWTDRWRNYGLIFAWIFFNIGVAITLYWVFRVRPTKKHSMTKTKKSKGASKQSTDSSESTSDEETKPETPGEGGRVTSPFVMAREAANDYLTANLARVSTNKRNAHVF